MQSWSILGICCADQAGRGAITCALRRARVAKAGDWGTVNLWGSKGALCTGAGLMSCM